MGRALILAVAAWTVTPAVLADSIVDDFSIASNPNGNFTYGQKASLGAAFVPFVNADSGPTFVRWYDADGPWPAVYPFVHKNITGADLGGPAYIFPHGWLDLRPGPAGEYIVVRWTAPTAGTYLIQGAYTGLETLPTTSDAWILLNNVGQFSASIVGQGYTGNGNVANFSLTLALAAGDDIDFTVGYGGNNFLGDSTALRGTITAVGTGPVPEPSTLALLGLGAWGASRLRRRSA
jgi:hypothetical protein